MLLTQVFDLRDRGMSSSGTSDEDIDARVSITLLQGGRPVSTPM